MERKQAVTHLEGLGYKRVEIDPVGPGTDQQRAQVELLLLFSTLQRSKRICCEIICYYNVMHNLAKLHNKMQWKVVLSLDIKK